MTVPVAPAVAPMVSVIVPARNESGNLGRLIDEIATAIAGIGDSIAGVGDGFEVIVVDDGSRDDTRAVLAALKVTRPWLRPLGHATSCGQSCAIRTGARAARGAVLVMLDGDGQNDPAFIPKLIAALGDGGPAMGLVAGQRVGRKDTGFKKFQSRVANSIRRRVLKDGTRDTGCGLKAIRREVYLALPYFDALHRFMPALVRREGYEVGLVDVIDRPRGAGVSNYGLWDRLWVGILDLYGVWWLIRRRRRVPEVTEV